MKIILENVALMKARRCTISGDLVAYFTSCPELAIFPQVVLYSYDISDSKSEIIVRDYSVSVISFY